MFNNVALDVVLGLVFVYLLYSLLGTLLQEIIATNIGLRGIMLNKAIRRMLDDDDKTYFTRTVFRNIKKALAEEISDKETLKNYYDFLDESFAGLSYGIEKALKSHFQKDTAAKRKIKTQTVEQFFDLLLAKFKKEKNNEVQQIKEAITTLKGRIEPIHNKSSDQITIPNKKLSNSFYSHPLIKYLASDNNFLKKKPAYIDKETFSKVMVDLLRGKNLQPGDPENLPIQKSLDTAEIAWEKDVPIEHETLSYLRSIWVDANADVQKLKLLLEQWFEEMMDRTTGWYKKWTQLILLFVGLLIAGAFNVDTLKIIKVLQNNPQIREQVLAQANTFNKAYPDKDKNAAGLKEIKDNLNEQAKNMVTGDIKQLNGVLGVGWDNKDNFDIWTSIAGWFLTALAISLGAPFWFDLLNRLMQLKSSIPSKDDAK